MANGLVLFVHGLGGNSSATWQRFPTYIDEDPDLADYDVGFFEYPTGLLRLAVWKRYPRIQALAQALCTTINNRFPTHHPIVLVGHSLGGLIARRYLVDEVMENDGLRVHKLLLYAVPNDGAGLARVAKQISRGHGQLKQLCRDSDFLTDLNGAWDRLRIGDKVEVRYVVAALDGVVTQTSAQALHGTRRVEVLADRDHRDCVKPRSADDLVYTILKNFILEEVPRPPARTSTKSPLRVIGFDLDGTLLRGLDFSWTLVWDHLGYPRDVQKQGMLRYLHGSTSYEEWCNWAVQMYRIRGLRREDLQQMARELPLTKNLREGIGSLKDQGFVTGIISGGIDVFLYEKLPDADQLFDYVFINRLEFDENGVVNGVQATPYDFQGKAEALEVMAQNSGCTMAQTVFVGEGFNDGFATAKAALSIAYPPRAYEQEAASHFQIEEDNIMRVVEAVIASSRD